MNTHWIDIARRYVPRQIRYAVQNFISFDEQKQQWRKAQNPDSNIRQHSGDPAYSGPKICILENYAQYHVYYIKACLELGIPFCVIDLMQDDWLVQVTESGCEIFLAWPDATQRPRAKIYKDRADLIENQLGFPVVPDSMERWLYEDKFRQRDWMQANKIPHTKSWIFTSRETAFEFSKNCQLPIVFKTSFGAAASGVKIIKTKPQLRKIIKKSFGKGHFANGHDHRDREWGSIFLQEHLPIEKEWRMVRIGQSYFGHPKGKLGEFHSGSGQALWDPPSDELLELLHQITEVGGFRSMDVDIFETLNGEFLVNELQCVFGASTSIDQMKVDGRSGRMVRQKDASWVFEAGDFAKNACANERIRTIIQVSESKSNR